MTLSSQLKRHEGLRLKPYLDSTGNLTIGYGHNLTENGIPQNIAVSLLNRGIGAARSDAVAIFGNHFDALSKPRQAVIVNMLFNLGLPRFRGFKQFIAAVNNSNWALAATEMLDSVWAIQVKSRAVELAAQMRTGAWSK